MTDAGVGGNGHADRPVQLVQVGAGESQASRGPDQPSQVKGDRVGGAVPDGDRLEDAVTHGDAVVEDGDCRGRLIKHGAVDVSEHGRRA